MSASPAPTRVLPAVVGLCVMIAGPACRPGPGPVNRPASGEQASSRPAEPQTPRPAAPSIGTVLDQWTAGRHEEALSTLMTISESYAAPACYRPFDITEPQFVALPQAEREALREKMLAGLVVLRKIARELDRRAREAAAAGDPERAAKLLEVMKRLGAANRGPEVTRLVDLVGQAIEKLAERGLSELRKQTTAGPPPSAGNPPGP